MTDKNSLTEEKLQSRKDLPLTNSLFPAWDETRLLAAVGVVLAVVFPVAGLPLSIYALRRSRQEGAESYVAKLGMQISLFVLALCLAVIVIGFVLSVVVPLISG